MCEGKQFRIGQKIIERRLMCPMVDAMSFNIRLPLSALQPPNHEREEKRLGTCALITGGSSGIGRAYARECARRGIHIVLVARSREGLESAQHECLHIAASNGHSDISCEILPADLSTVEGCDAVRQRLESGKRPVDIFINNAGQGFYHRLATRESEPLAHAIDLMGTVPVLLGGYAAAVFCERGHGTIITTASVNAYAPLGLYSGIKAMVRQWALSLEVELSGMGVKSVCVMPGWVRTQFHARAGVKRSNIPDWLWLDASDLVEEVWDKVLSGHTLITPSLRYRLIGGLARHAPTNALMRVAAKINRGRENL